MGQAVPGGNLAGHAWLVVNQPGNYVLLKGLVPFSPDPPMGKPPFPQPGQQGVVCHPGDQFEALQQRVLSNLICQRWVVQYIALRVCTQP